MVEHYARIAQVDVEQAYGMLLGWGITGWKLQTVIFRALDFF
jgi:hypothetical protein